MNATLSEAFIRTSAPHAAWGVEQLETFNDFMPTGPWTADLKRERYRQGGRELRISVLGSYDVSGHSWLWGWANPGLEDLPVVGAGLAVRDLGEEHGVPEFTEEFVDMSVHEDPRRAAETLAFGAMTAVGAGGYIGVEAGPGTRLYMVPNDPRIPRAEVDPVALPRVLTTGADVVGGSAWPVVSGYFVHHDLPQRRGPGRISAELPSGGTVTVSFDGHGRIARVDIDAAGPVALPSRGVDAGR